MAVAVPNAIKTIAEAESRFNLQRTEDADFFAEWHSPLPTLSSEESRQLQALRQRYLYQRSTGKLLEGTVALLLASPLLAIAGSYALIHSQIRQARPKSSVAVYSISNTYSTGYHLSLTSLIL